MTGPAAPPSPEQLARAFSGHRFEEVLPHLALDVRWVQVGGSTRQGRDAVVEACRASAAELSGTSTTFRRFVVVADDHAAAVDTVGEYVDPSGQVFVVASCDVYELAGGQLAAITSYAVELPAEG